MLLTLKALQFSEEGVPAASLKVFISSSYVTAGADPTIISKNRAPIRNKQMFTE